VRMEPIRCPETSVNNYHTTPCNNPEDQRFNQHRGGSLKSRLLREICKKNYFKQCYHSNLYPNHNASYDNSYSEHSCSENAVILP
jgi:hypothetical protein